MDADVARLVREERIVDAAKLASARGDACTASALFERACEFRQAAEEALRAGDFARALPLALDGKDEDAAARALPGLLQDPAAAERVSFHLERRGYHLWRGRLLQGIGKSALAARAFEQAGNALEAAALLEAAGDVMSAARVLEAQARKEPTRGELHVALGALLLRYGKVDAAVRALQKVDESSPERRAALSALTLAFGRLDLTEARAEADRELAKLGGPVPATGEERSAILVRTRLFGRYEIACEVASSPSARVLECFDVIRNERVAVKIFSGYDAHGTGRDALARFAREVEILASLNHPNIVPLREYVSDGPALVLAWMSHGTLERMIEREPLAPARAVEIAEAILAALGEAHRLAVIHRDVKPANVMFDDAGVTRLGDFGVSHLGDLSATATAGVIGTLGYMSPEQREGHPATIQSDLYGVGAILWEMLTGERYAADRPTEAGHTRPSGVHRELDARHDAVVMAFLSRDPADRPGDAFAARRSLGAVDWPDSIERAAAPRSERPKSVRPNASRLVPQPDGTAIDGWLDRRVVTLPLEPKSLERASVFARADHACLQTVLRVDRETSCIWLADLRGSPPRQKLSTAQHATLREALTRLHELGAVHGSVDAAHVMIDETGAAVLAFPAAVTSSATAELDLVALAQLHEAGH